jgi:hypothetical protein
VSSWRKRSRTDRNQSSGDCASSQQIDRFADKYGLLRIKRVGIFNHPPTSNSRVPHDERGLSLTIGCPLALFNQFAESRAMTRRDFLSLARQWIGDIKRRLHGPYFCVRKYGQQYHHCQARAFAGEDAVYYGTKLRGASNHKAKKTFCFEPVVWNGWADQVQVMPDRDQGGDDGIPALPSLRCLPSKRPFQLRQRSR